MAEGAAAAEAEEAPAAEGPGMEAAAEGEKDENKLAEGDAAALAADAVEVSVTSLFGNVCCLLFGTRLAFAYGLRKPLVSAASLLV